MELSNDLVTIISLYSTTPVTFNVITVGDSLAGQLYKSFLWKSKALYEARGLIAEDSLVEKAGWYAYYLITNRTFYGNRYQGTVGYGYEGGPLVTFIGDAYGHLLEQYPNRKLKLWAEPGLNPTEFRPIVSCSSGLAVTEDGNLFLLAPDGYHIPIQNTGDVVQAARSDDFQFILLRTGTVQAERVGIRVPIEPPTEKIISLSTVEEFLLMITSSGTELHYDIPSLVLSSSFGRIIANDVSPRLKRINQKTPVGMRVVKSVHSAAPSLLPFSAIIDTTRSLVIIDEQTGESRIKFSGRVQTGVELIGDTIAFIVDPLANGS